MLPLKNRFVFVSKILSLEESKIKLVNIDIGVLHENLLQFGI